MSVKLCINHTDREAESKCISCFKPICNECIIRYKSQDYCSDQCAEGAEQTGAKIDEISSGQHRIRKKRILKKMLFFIIFIIMCILFYLFVFKNEGLIQIFKGKLEEAKGTVLQPDDFYHAKGGVWKMETAIHILKSMKFVSSENELKSYLVATAKPGTVVRISDSKGRWKKLQIIHNGKMKSSGWADAEDARAEWISETLVE